MIPFGKILKTLRMDRNWSQAQLAVKLGISDSQVAHYESEDRLPSLPILVRASHIFGVTTDYLLGLSSTRDNWLDVSDLFQDEIEILSQIADSYRRLLH